MARGLIKLEWNVDANGHTLVDRGDAGDEPTLLGNELIDRRYVVPRSGRLRSYERSLGAGSDVVAQLASMPLTPEGVVGFADEWGLLAKQSALQVNDFYQASILIQQAIEKPERDQFTSTIETLSIVYGGGLGLLETRFGWEGAKRTPFLYFRPRTLIQFCWLELMQQRVGGANLQTARDVKGSCRLGIGGDPRNIAQTPVAKRRTTFERINSGHNQRKPSAAKGFPLVVTKVRRLFACTVGMPRAFVTHAWEHDEGKSLKVACKARNDCSRISAGDRGCLCWLGRQALSRWRGRRQIPQPQRHGRRCLGQGRAR